MHVCSFLREASANAIGSFFGALVLLVLVERTWHLRDALNEKRAANKERRERRDAVLRSLLTELKSNAGTVPLAEASLGGGRVPFPLFDAAALLLAWEPSIYETLPASTAEALLHVHNRLESANEMHRIVFDVTQGSASLLAGLVAASAETPTMVTIYAAFRRDQDRLRNALLTRCQDVAPHLHTAIDAVEADLGITGDRPAAQRVFVHGAGSIEYVGTPD